MFKFTFIAGVLLALSGYIHGAQAAQPGSASTATSTATDMRHSRSLFSSLPAAVRAADSGIDIGVGAFHQHYVEDQSGSTLDSERGTLTAVTLGLGEQGDHFGWDAGLHYAQGNDGYDGALQSCTSSGCTITPATAATHNRMLDATLSADYGFSPLPHLAVLPEVFFGEHVWYRSVRGPGGVDETYTNLFYGAGLGVQYAQGPLVFGVRGRYGRTAAAHMTLDSRNGFSLGSAPMYSVRARVTWVALPWLKVYVGDTFTGFSYGVSDTQDVGGGVMAREPHSRTLQNVVEAGVKLL